MGIDTYVTNGYYCTSCKVLSVGRQESRAAHPSLLSGAAHLARDGAVALQIARVGRLEVARVLVALPRPELAILYRVLANVS